MRHGLIFLCLLFSLSAYAGEKPVVNQLLQSAITGVDNHHVLISKVTIPANTSLPRHYHPTEEYLYVLAGRTILQIDGQDETLLTAGMSAKIPANVLHTGITQSSAAELIVFRVQPKRQPIYITPEN